jgi:hypothetical protein
MLHVSITRDAQGLIASFEARGHTGLAPTGSDVACAGASALVQAAVLGCQRHLRIAPGIQQEEGFLYFTLPMQMEEGANGKAQAILETMLAGLEEISHLYPGRIEIETLVLPS